MSKRGLLLCTLARQKTNDSSSESQVLNYRKHTQASDTVSKVAPQKDGTEDDSQVGKYDHKVLQWLNDSSKVDYFEDISEQVQSRTDIDEDTTEQLKENIDNVDNVKEMVNIVHEEIANVIPQTGRTNTEAGFQSDGPDFSGTDSGKDKDYIPEKGRKRKIIVPESSSSSTSTSSSSNSSSTSSSSSSSSMSTNSNTEAANLPETSTQTNDKQLLNAHELPPITTQNYNSECEFQPTLALPTNPKKKARNPAAWKQNIRKELKNTGQEHVNSLGKLVAAKKMGPPCTEKCLLSCSKKIPIEDRQQIFTGYWELGCLTRQRDYVAACLTTLAPEYRRLKTNPKFARKPNSCFHLPIRGDNIRVCKTFFIRTLAITPRFLRHIIDKKTATGSVPPDKRGTLTKKRIDAEIHESVRVHINSIPRIESHYLRAQTTRQFIDGQYTIADLHRLYCEDRKTNNKSCATYDFYNRVFNQEFNISFFKPKKDQCDQCVSYNNSSNAEKLQKEDEFKRHLKEKTLSREEKEADMKLLNELGNEKLIVAIYDLQAVLPVPLGNSSAFFYKSKLNCYNFTVTDFKDKLTSCYFWHEGLGNRGVNEIGSCVYYFLEELSRKNPNCDVIFYSDNCCGQQKNKFMFNLYYYAVNTLQINSIQHKFLIRGHTQSAADSAHSVIEKAVKRAKKSGPIYIPAQYAQLIRSAKKTGNPFILKEMNFTDFYNLKSLAEDISLNVTKASNGQAMKVTEISHLKFIKDSDVYYFKTTYDGDWIEVNRNQTITRSARVQPPQRVALKQAYESKIPLAPRKKADIQNLIDTNIIPKVYETIYNTIF